MDTNLDIDRISLEDRIKALEARPPAGGGGGGGGSNFFVDPDVVDQYPDNSITDVGNGILVKVSIDDIGTAPVLPGYGRRHRDFGFKVASFFPKINGLYYSCSSTLIRVVVLRPSSLTQSGGSNDSYLRIDFDISLLDTLFGSLQIEGQGTLPQLHLWNNFQLGPLEDIMGGVPAGLFAIFSGSILFTSKTSAGAALLFASQNVGTTGTAGQCCCFGAGTFNLVPFHSSKPPVNIYGGIVGAVLQQGQYGSFVGHTPQDLPAAFRPVYPASWYA